MPRVFEIGNSLREARLRRHIEFADAEHGTKIRGKYLRALEDERFELLPSHTYIKGFLRSYAEYLGLDGQLYVDEYNSRFVVGEEEAPVARPPRARRAGEARGPARVEHRRPRAGRDRGRDGARDRGVALRQPRGRAVHGLKTSTPQQRRRCRRRRRPGRRGSSCGRRAATRT